jgi:CBS domain-containing membrane protein
MQILNHFITLFNSERWRASLGALLGMGICSIFLHAVNSSGHWVLTPLAATMVILYVQPHSPVAQPWPVAGSYFICCLVGFFCVHWLAPIQLAVTVAIAASIWLMVRFHCIHPPGAAMAMLIVLDGPHSSSGMTQLAGQMVLNIGIALGSTMLVSNFILRRPYPYQAQVTAPSLHRTQDDAPLRRIGLAMKTLPVPWPRWKPLWTCRKTNWWKYITLPWITRSDAMLD